MNYPLYGQPYRPQQPFGARVPGPQQFGQPHPGIAVTTHFSPLSFMLALFKPKVLIDGYEAPVTGWGRAVLPAQPGRHRVHVHVPYLLPSKIGAADTVVDVYPGRLTELEYKAPVWAFSPGALGYPPQPYNGVSILLAVLAILVAVPFLLLFLLVLIAI
ncbi:hypothetical protein [Mycobacterium sp. 1423905.2]|uniref:hypothetical protein n=1 Tax=Mycobacterium sp. 1423905.2 TaxID=1856859 RepID=UPI0007FB915C|nr:hypothetical protein [Mycobacterium sp. 1423905.2]OBJ61598.1 hypothetical protein A9W95_09210 [Mycobacterium sp. 1423905.2]